MTSAENPYAGHGSVLIDVGGEVGALVVTMPASLMGAEIEIRPLHLAPDAHFHPGSRDPHQNGQPSHLTHVEVLPRRTPDGLVSCAVFPGLAAGRYKLYVRSLGKVRLTISIAGGELVQAAWPEPGDAASST